MKISSLSRYSLGSCFAALLAGCAGSQPPIGAPGAMPQTRAIATHAKHGGSWMLPEAKSKNLIYTTGGCGGACILSYPDGAKVASATISGIVNGACADSQGNVFITNDSKVLKFAHGGTTPMATLSLPGSGANGCTVDPMTGNLAVVFNGSAVNIAIFQHASGIPTTYGSHITSFYCGYDNAGNLFVSGEASGSESGISELTSGAADFSILSINGKLGATGQIQWDGQYLSFEGINKNDVKIFRLAVSGSSATVISTKRYKPIRGFAYQSWLQGDRVLIPYSNHGQYANFLGIWKYPAGGSIRTKIHHLGKLTALRGVAVSVASRH